MHTFKTKLIAGATAATVLLGSAGIALAEIETSVTADVSVETQAVGKATKSRSNIQNNRTASDKEHESNDDRDDENKGKGELRTMAVASSTATSTNKGKRIETKIQIKAKLNAKKQQAVVKVIDNRVKAYAHLIAQQSKRVDRVAEVAAKIDSTTASSSPALGFIADARAKLAHASSTLLSINATATSTASSSNPTASLTSVKSKFDIVHNDIVAAHQATAKAIAALKGLGKKTINNIENNNGTTTNPTASTTTTVTASTTVSN